MTIPTLCEAIKAKGYAVEPSDNGSQATLRTATNSYVFTVVNHEGQKAVEVERSSGQRLRYAYFPVAEPDCLERVARHIMTKEGVS